MSVPADTRSDGPITWNGSPVGPLIGLRRWLNIWRLRYVVEGGVYIEFYRTNRGRVVVTRVNVTLA